MNLRWFHALLILLSAILAVVYGVWALDQSLAAAVAAFVVSFGLVLYDSWFLRKTRMLR